MKYEALRHFIVLGLPQFDHIVSEYVTCYHECRPYQGIGNRLIGREADDDELPPINIDDIRCQSRLGGLL